MGGHLSRDARRKEDLALSFTTKVVICKRCKFRQEWVARSAQNVPCIECESRIFDVERKRYLVLFNKTIRLR